MERDKKTNVNDKVIDFLIKSTPEERVAFFDVESINASTDKERREEWIRRFLIWSRFYFVPDFLYSRAPFHYKMFGWMFSMLYEDDNAYQQYVVATAREFLKTLDTKHFLIYGHAYGLIHYSNYISASYKKIEQEFSDMRNKLKSPLFVNDYGNIIARDTINDIKFIEDKGKLSGATISTFRRGITEEGLKPDFLIGDDIETTDTQLSLVETENNWKKYTTDIVSSMLGTKRRIFHITNYTSIRGNQQRLLDATDKDCKMVVGLYADEKEKVLTWSSRYAHTAEQAKGTDPPKIAIDELKKTYTGLVGGERAWRAEMLCKPTGDDELYHSVSKIVKFCEPMKEPLRVFEDADIKYNVYKEFDPAKQYIAGVDTSEGVGLDSNAMVLLAYDNVKAEVVANASSNKVKQDVFCQSNIRFWGSYGTSPFVVPEANMGGLYINELTKNYNFNLIYHREKQGAIGMEITEQYGLQMTSVVNRGVVGAKLRSALESGDLINHSADLHVELSMFTDVDHMDNRRVSFVNSPIGTMHFDLISAARMAYWGLSQSTTNRRVMNTPSLAEQGFYKGAKGIDKHNPYRNIHK